jgi:hypothetical protein
VSAHARAYRLAAGGVTSAPGLKNSVFRSSATKPLLPDASASSSSAADASRSVIDASKAAMASSSLESRIVGHEFKLALSRTGAERREGSRQQLAHDWRLRHPLESGDRRRARIACALDLQEPADRGDVSVLRALPEQVEQLGLGERVARPRGLVDVGSATSWRTQRPRLTPRAFARPPGARTRPG